jgi:hypothetical protein
LYNRPKVLKKGTWYSYDGHEEIVSKSNFNNYNYKKKKNGNTPNHLRFSARFSGTPGVSPADGW